jgi:hypothetical protein
MRLGHDVQKVEYILGSTTLRSTIEGVSMGIDDAHMQKTLTGELLQKWQDLKL